jgi:Flp pilus assembly protein TadB
VTGAVSATTLLAVLAGAVAGGGLFLLVAAIRGLPPSRAPGRLDQQLRDLFGVRGAVAAGVGIIALLATGWVVAAVGMAALAFSWRGLTGAAGERRALARLEGLAIWTESLRDTIAGAVGLEQAIPASMRVASPTLSMPLAGLVDRMHTRMPLPDALRRFADDLDDPSADLIIAALIINSRLRGPGLRDLLGSLAHSVRDELDVRRKVNADRKSTRRSVQIVVLVSVGMALVLAILDHKFLKPYNGVFGQAVLVIVVCIYAAGIGWLRRLARFDAPERLLAAYPVAGSPGSFDQAGSAGVAAATAQGGSP